MRAFCPGRVQPSSGSGYGRRGRIRLWRENHILHDHEGFLSAKQETKPPSVNGMQSRGTPEKLEVIYRRWKGD
jgi:hypothetical protein